MAEVDRQARSAANVYPLKQGEFSLQSWLEELPDDAIEREMGALQEQIQTLTARYNTLREARDLKQRLQHFRPGMGLPPQPSSISKAVLLAMDLNSERAEWTVGDIYRALVDRGWLEDSNRCLRSLGAALSRMYSDGEIQRVSRGRYAQPLTNTARTT